MGKRESHRAKCRLDSRGLQWCPNPITSPLASTGGIHHPCCHPGPRSGASIIHSSGFTLIELLVVIAIIALLMAILIPTLSRVRKQAKAMVCQSRLRQWGTILALYAQDNEGHFPCNLTGTAGVWLLRGTLLSINNKDPNASQDSFFHFRTKDIACCPLATKCNPVYQNFGSPGSLPVSLDGVGPQYLPGSVGPTYPAWVIYAPRPAFPGSYGMNEFLFRLGFQSSFPSDRFSEPPPVNIFSLGNKANVPVVLDSAAPSGGPYSASGPPPSNLSSLGIGSAAFCVSRHDDFVNALFLDWSMRKVGLKELWKLKWSQDFNTNGPWTLAGSVKPDKWPEWMRNMKDY